METNKELINVSVNSNAHNRDLTEKSILKEDFYRFSFDSYHRFCIELYRCKDDVLVFDRLVYLSESLLPGDRLSVHFSGYFDGSEFSFAQKEGYYE